MAQAHNGLWCRRANVHAIHNTRINFHGVLVDGYLWGGKIVEMKYALLLLLLPVISHSQGTIRNFTLTSHDTVVCNGISFIGGNKPDHYNQIVIRYGDIDIFINADVHMDSIRVKNNR